MQTMSSFQSSHLSLVKPYHLHRTVAAPFTQSMNARVQELTSVLQTTLEQTKLIELFADKLTKYIKLDGLDYQSPDEKVNRKIGTLSTHRATYDLKLEQTNLGSVHFYRDRTFSSKEIELLENMLSALVYPLHNALDYQHAMEMASYDALTGVQNRRTMDITLQREVELAHRKQSPLSMLILDADNFKQFNDTYGHAYGDAVLKTIADTINTTIRGSDLLFRFGGEEFVVLTSQTVSNGAHLLAERIRKNIEAIRQINSIKIHTTVSLGVATLLPDETAQAFFERADSAVYAAKQAGRNTTAIAEQIPEKK